MIPIRDTIPSSRFPIVTILIITVNSMIFVFQWLMGPYLHGFVEHFGIIPAKYFWLADVQASNYSDRFLPLFSSMFLHGGWMHVIANMWYLWIFGDNVEDRFGRFGFLGFYLLCGLTAGLTHVYLSPDSTVPTIGASGAIAGVMGAYMVLFPTSRVVTMIPLVIFFPIVEIPAVFFLGFWFLMQFFQGTASMFAAQNVGGVAWWAHFGGFAVGAAIAIFIRRTRNDHVRIDGHEDHFVPR
jgi:membrane associated rhomboid family serine protease